MNTGPDTIYSSSKVKPTDLQVPTPPDGHDWEAYDKMPPEQRSLYDQFCGMHCMSVAETVALWMKSVDCSKSARARIIAVPITEPKEETQPAKEPGQFVTEEEIPKLDAFPTKGLAQFLNARFAEKTAALREEVEDEWAYTVMQMRQEVKEKDAEIAGLRAHSDQRAAGLVSEMSRMGQEITALKAELAAVKELICHAEVHSAYSRCGRAQMTTEQQALWDLIWRENVEAHPAAPADDGRSDFEAWAKTTEVKYNLERWEDGYANTWTSRAWEGWQAARKQA